MTRTLHVPGVRFRANGLATRLVETARVHAWHTSAKRHRWPCKRNDAPKVTSRQHLATHIHAIQTLRSVEPTHSLLTYTHAATHTNTLRRAILRLVLKEAVHTIDADQKRNLRRVGEGGDTSTTALFRVTPQYLPRSTDSLSEHLHVAATLKRLWSEKWAQVVLTQQLRVRVYDSRRVRMLHACHILLNTRATLTGTWTATHTRTKVHSTSNVSLLLNNASSPRSPAIGCKRSLSGKLTHTLNVGLLPSSPTARQLDPVCVTRKKRPVSLPGWWSLLKGNKLRMGLDVQGSLATMTLARQVGSRGPSYCCYTHQLKVIFSPEHINAASAAILRGFVTYAKTPCDYDAFIGRVLSFCRF